MSFDNKVAEKLAAPIISKSDVLVVPPDPYATKAEVQKFFSPETSATAESNKEYSFLDGLGSPRPSLDPDPLLEIFYAANHQEANQALPTDPEALHQEIDGQVADIGRLLLLKRMGLSPEDIQNSFAVNTENISSSSGYKAANNKTPTFGYEFSLPLETGDYTVGITLAYQKDSSYATTPGTLKSFLIESPDIDMTTMVISQNRPYTPIFSYSKGQVDGQTIITVDQKGASGRKYDSKSAQNDTGPILRMIGMLDQIIETPFKQVGKISLDQIPPGTP